MTKAILVSFISLASLMSCKENLEKAEEKLSQNSLGSVVTDVSQNLELASEESQEALKQEETVAPEADIQAPVEEVKKAVKLKAYNFKSTGLRMKLNNTPEPTTKAKNCVQVMSTFTIGENTLLTPGFRSVYLRVTNPNGDILQGKSGGVVTDVDGKDFLYSAKKDLEYKNLAVDVSMYYDLNGEEPLKGTYKVNILFDGYMIGSDSFTLK